MIHNPSDRVAKMLVEIASYDPRAEVSHLPLSKAFKLSDKAKPVDGNALSRKFRGLLLSRSYCRRHGFMPWNIWSHRLGMVIGQGHTLARCAKATLKRLRTGKWGPLFAS